ncbi:MAG TPA: metal ABC transporter permease [Xanthobacteraceae bacterium]|nr:metal ABC transporter permease [Xanthobacteraceae bacterium]
MSLALSEALTRLFEVLTLQAGYNANTVIAGTAVLGAAAGVVGTFVFLRGRALISDALSHATLPGIVLAFLAGAAIGIETRSLPLLLAGATVTGLIGVALMHALTRLSRVTEDSAIGAVLGSFFGLGVVLLSYVQNLPLAGQAGLHHFLLGQAAAMARSEAITIAVLAAFALAVVLYFFKEFRLIAFDRDFAAGLGWPVARIDLAMAGLGVAVTVIGLQTVGLVMIVALLVVPPVAARFWSNDVRTVALLAGIFGALSAYVGAAASYALSDMPTGAAIVLAAGVFAITGLLFAPRRGVIGVALSALRFRLELGRVRWLARITAGETAPHADPWLRLYLRAAGLSDASGQATARALHEAPAAARNLSLWLAAITRRPEAVPVNARFGVDAAHAVLPRDLLDEIEGRTA